MAVPTLTIAVDWDLDGSYVDAQSNITADVLSMTYGRGASFDGGMEGPGYCDLVVQNLDGKYNPDNSSSPLYGLVLPNRPVHVSAVYSGTTYGLFHGILRRATPRADRTATLHFEDALSLLARAEAHVPYSRTRSIRAMRTQVLDDAGIPSACRSLAGGVEDDIPVTWADRFSCLALLEELNIATGSLHYINPQSTSGTPYKYTTLDRGALLAGTSVETWTEGMVDIGGIEMSDERLINEQAVTPIGLVSNPLQTVWTRSPLPFSVSPSGTRTVWARFDTPIKEPTLYTQSTGSASISTTWYAEAAKFVITAGTAGVRYTDFHVNAEPLVASDASTVVVVDATSKIAYQTYWDRRRNRRYTRRYASRDYGVREGSEIASPWIVSEAAAQGLGEWIVFRHKDPRTAPTFTRQNDFPSMLQRDVGQVVTATLSLFNVTSKRYYIRSIETTVTDSAKLWRTTYGLEEAPVADTWFILDLAGHGLTDGKLAY